MAGKKPAIVAAIEKAPALTGTALAAARKALALPPATTGKPAVTGRALAVTKGKGKKTGLKRQGYGS